MRERLSCRFSAGRGNHLGPFNCPRTERNLEIAKTRIVHCLKSSTSRIIISISIRKTGLSFPTVVICRHVLHVHTYLKL